MLISWVLQLPFRQIKWEIPLDLVVYLAVKIEPEAIGIEHGVMNKSWLWRQYFCSLNMSDIWQAAALLWFNIIIFSVSMDYRHLEFSWELPTVTSWRGQCLFIFIFIFFHGLGVDMPRFLWLAHGHSEKAGAEKWTELVLIRSQECVLSGVLCFLQLLKSAAADWKMMLSERSTEYNRND